MSKTLNIDDFQLALDQSMAALRDYDRDQYLTLLLIKNQAARSALALLHAFNVEIRRIPAIASEPMIGEIRMTWWREVLEGVRAEEVKGHPLALALLWLIQHYDLAREDLINLIEARRFDLYQDPMPTLNDLEGYAGECYSKLLQLSVKILAREYEIENDERLETLADACGHGGVVLCLSEHLAHISYDNKMRRQYIPSNLLEAAGTSQAALFKGENNGGNQNLLEMVMTIARDHLKSASHSIDQLPNPLRGAFKSLALCRYDLDRVEKMGCKILQNPLPQTPVRRQFALWRGQY